MADLGWTCPSCGRRFARAGQSHECSPAMELDEYLASGPAFERPIVEAVLAYLETVGPVFLEPVSVGLFIKTPAGGKVAELRPLTKWMAMWIHLTHGVDDRRVTRKPSPTSDGWWYVVNLRTPADVDDRVRGWLAEAYLGAA